MKWLSTIVRVAGSQFPGASALVQLQSEIESAALEKRVRKLEDPISILHDDVPEISRIIYDEVRANDSAVIEFSDDVLTRFSRSLAALNSAGYIESKFRLGRQLPTMIQLSDASYVMYLCALFESAESMERLVQIMEKCKVGEWLEGAAIAQKLNLPTLAVRACFEIYAAKRFGFCSREVGRISYCGNA